MLAKGPGLGADMVFLDLEDAVAPMEKPAARDKIIKAINDLKKVRGAVILGGSYGSLAVARSLGRHGIPVCSFSAQPSIARHPRPVTRYIAWAGPGRPHALHPRPVGSRQSGYARAVFLPMRGRGGELRATANPEVGGPRGHEKEEEGHAEGQAEKDECDHDWD